MIKSPNFEIVFRRGVFAAILALSVLTLVPTAHAEDFGNWARNTNGSALSNCPSGNGCFWSPTEGYSNRADRRDSFFPNNLSYASGTNMNDNVRKIYNRMTVTNMRTYLHADYVTALSSCLPPGWWQGPWDTTQDNASSWKSC